MVIINRFLIETDLLKAWHTKRLTYRDTHMYRDWIYSDIDIMTYVEKLDIHRYRYNGLYRVIEYTKI